MIGSRIITMEFDNKSFWIFTTALKKKTVRRILFFYKIISDSVLINVCATMDDFLYSYCCPKLSVRYGQRRQERTESVQNGQTAASTCQPEDQVADPQSGHDSLDQGEG